MSSTTETRTLVDAIVDNADERELWITGRLFEHAPYFHAGKGGDTRLAEGLRMCLEDKITPQSDGSYQVQGSGGRVYRVAESCSCPASQHAKSRWCKHAVGVAVYIEWQRRIRPSQPVALGTLRAGTLPLPPVTVDERLAQPPQEDDLPLIAPREDGPVYTTSDGTRYTLESRPYLQPPVTVDERLAQAATVAMDHVYDALPVPQEDHMPDDEYLSEPDEQDTPVAIVEPPAPAPRPLPGPVLLPSLDAQTLERSMTAWSAQRQVIRRFLQQELKEGVDFYRLQVRGKDANPTLSKAGAEKFLGLFQLQASFAPDLLTWEMLGKPTDHVIYICTLRTRSGEIVGEGRGSRSLKKDSGDTNKAIKMSEKSALIDAVLRTGALSEVYTQDIGDEDETPPAPPAPAKAATPAKPTSQDLRQRIWHMVQAQAPEARTREAVETWLKQETGYDLHPDHYGAVVAALEARA